MTDNETNLTRLKSHIDRLGPHWNVDEPTRPERYEGVEHLVIFTYCMAGDWNDFYALLREARKEMDTLIEMETI